jgi:predicted transcriptional regulator
MVRRSKVDVIWDMLIAIQVAGGSIKPTRLLYKSNLSYNKMVEYLAELEESSLILIKKLDERKIISITDKGHYYVSELRKAKNLAESIGLK